jgi:hypothetical protein
MAKVYLSATYSDLKKHRNVVYRLLRKARHDVIAMEDYVATDQYPLSKCLNDVAGSDLYVGLIGWRYGYIPLLDNAESRSITELEYRRAGDARIPRLMFLADKDASWPDAAKDSVTGEGDGGKRVAALRVELQSATLVGFFKSPDQLAGLVLAAVYRALEAQSGVHAKSASSVKEVKTTALKGHLENLILQYEAVSLGIDTMIEPAALVKLKKQLEVLEDEMAHVESQLQTLK